MPTLNVYGPNAPETSDGSCYVMPIGYDERQTWASRLPMLPPLTSGDRDAFVQDYRNLMSRLDDENRQSDSYWYSALGSRNTQNSLFYTGLEQLWRLDRYLRQDERRPFDGRLTVPSQHFLAPIRQLAAKHGWESRIAGGYDVRVFNPLRGPVAALLNLLTLCDWGRKYGDHGPSDCAIVMATVSGDGILSANRDERDYIFGNLPADLQAAGDNVVMFAHLLGAIQPAADKARGMTPPAVRTLVDLVRPRDTFGQILKSLTWRPRIPALRCDLGIDIAPLIRADIAKCRWHDLPLLHLQRLAFARLLARNPTAILLHPFENNSWEHACRSAATAANARTVAIQHNALLMSHEKLHATGARPQPDAIVAAGPKAKELLHKTFGYADTKLTAAYSVRQSGIFAHSAKTVPPDSAVRILVLLQATPETIELLDLLAATFPESHNGVVTLRPHPSVALQDQLSQSKLTAMRLPFRESDQTDLHRDILQHDIAIFSGSTAGAESVALGVPAIYVDLGHAAMANPLSPEPALSRTAHTAGDIVDALRELSAYAQDAFDTDQKRARQFFENSFAPKTEDGFKNLRATLQTIRMS